jgi:hypothetical protein
MNFIEGKDLEPNGIYWARRKATASQPPAAPSEVRVVQVSTAFGSIPEFLTIAIIGSDEHFALDEFEFVSAIKAPALVG